MIREAIPTLLLFGIAAASACSKGEPAPAPRPRVQVPADFKPWLAKAFVPRCSLTVNKVESDSRIIVGASFGSVPPNPPNHWTYELTFERTTDGWTCHTADDTELHCAILSVHCTPPIAPATEADIKASNPAKTAPKCMRTARAVIKKGKACGLDMSKYTPEKICAWYLVNEDFTDAQIAGGLSVHLEQDCDALKAEVETDGI